jgi:hypothetical protein
MRKLSRWWRYSRFRRIERRSIDSTGQRLRLFERFGRGRRCALIRPLIRRVEIAAAIATQLPSPGLRRTLIGPAIVLVEVTAAVVAKLPPAGSSGRHPRCCHEADDQQEQRNPTSAYEPHVAPTFPEGRRRAECNCIAGAVADGAVRAGDPIRCVACTRSRNMNEHEATVNARRNGQAVVGGTIIAERCQKPVSTLSDVLQIRDSTVLYLSREGGIAVPA